MMFTLYSADFINAPSNCSYPHKFEITDAATLADAVKRDYVCAEYMNNYRSGDNFLGSDCLPVDCDNDHSENLGSSCYLSASGSSLCVNGTAISGGSTSGSDFAGKEVKMGGSTTYYIVCNTSRELRPSSSSTTYPGYLGTSTYYWHYAYIGSNTVKIGSTASSKLAFFAGSPIARQTLSTTSNNMSYTSATASNYLYILNNLVGILKNKYGLIG